MPHHQAPELRVSQWFNQPVPSLASLRGRVVLLHAFQMLCPGCVSHGIPQAVAVSRNFAPAELLVIGLHTVFEHHAVMGADVLQVFLHEYRIPFSVGIDQVADSSPIPLTMQAYAMQGTPTFVLIDRQGVIRMQHFGVMDDLQLGVAIGRLLAEPIAVDKTVEDFESLKCDAEKCQI
ncbi:hypothetical protein R6242_04135 [Iodobacter sp. CM08]|uniref:hypothetical protein n=1 Tax=Iodobacter sp. CM08 TaxID=3085902 RepID=UPI002981A88C|nr:hypothetical protein [Iodobacter sp. CM08]MDW5415759.1 hypothetical protein [Iodobacter sp. CM08]